MGAAKLTFHRFLAPGGDTLMQWVIVAYLCSPLVAPSTTTGCMFETFGPTRLKKSAPPLNQSMPPDPRTFTSMSAGKQHGLLAGQEGPGESHTRQPRRYPSRQ